MKITSRSSSLGLSLLMAALMVFLFGESIILSAIWLAGLFWGLPWIYRHVISKTFGSDIQHALLTAAVGLFWTGLFLLF